jgi:hypothetical protein
MLSEMQKKRLMLEQLNREKAQEAVVRRTIKLQEQMALLQEKINSL